MDDAQSVSTMVNEKRDALVRIRDITLTQASFIEQDKTERLLDSIETRQMLINRIDAIDEKLEGRSLKREMPEYAGVAEEMRGLLTEIIDTDKANEQRMRERMEVYKKGLRELSNQKKTNSAYERMVGFEGSVYLDKRN